MLAVRFNCSRAPKLAVLLTRIREEHLDPARTLRSGFDSFLLCLCIYFGQARGWADFATSRDK